MRNEIIADSVNRRSFIGGSDARIIMGNDEAALVRLWREKRGEAERPDYSDNLIVQLGVATEPLNRHWYERTTGQLVKDVQSWVRHPVIRWMAATLDGVVEGTGAVFEAKFMLPWWFSEEAAAEKHMAQVQHNMWVTNAREAALSVITGGGKWVEIKLTADSLYQHLLLTAERKFWRCVVSGEPPRLFGLEPPRARIGAVRIVDMSSSNAWAEFSNVFRRTREAYLEHENAEQQLSASLRESLIEQMATINSADEAAAWAHRSLPAKNTLTAADAKTVEEQFAVRLREIGDRQEPDEPSNGPPAVGTPGGATPDGPPHAVADQSLAARASTTTTSQKPFKGTKKQSHSDAVRALGKTVRLRDKDHRKFVLRQPCLVCGRVPSDSHHLTFTQPRALGRRVSDEFTVPVCRVHHRELHRSGDEAAWWRGLNIDPVPVALKLWQQTRGNERIVLHAKAADTPEVSAQPVASRDQNGHPNNAA